MASANCIRISFEQPSHGWLPVKFSSHDFKLDIDASDVPINPVYLLYRAILDVVDGIEASVWWHLEPTGYCFDFSQPQSQLYYLAIKYQANDNDQAPEFLYETTGTATEIILPFCRAIKRLASYEHKEYDWPRLEKKQLASLDSVIKFLKNEP